MRTTQRSARVIATVVAVGLALVGGSCNSGSTSATESSSPGTDPSLVTPPTDAVTAESLCTEAVPVSSDAVASTDLVEASGLVASRDHDGVLWSHNDSGGNAELFALGFDGSDLGRLEVAGAQAVDWEDIALLPGPDGGPDLLFAADIGDNFGRGMRTEPVRVYRVAEPAAPGKSATTTAPATAFDLTYADGARDAETLLADPLTGDLFVVSKQWDGADAGVYRIPADVVAAPTAPTTPVTMARVGAAAGTARDLVTGGDVSPDGTVIALRTYRDLRLWNRDPGESVADALARPPACSVAVAEPQGEAVAFTADGRGFVTVSEGAGVPVLVRRIP